jgi:hypothetical protein
MQKKPGDMDCTYVKDNLFNYTEGLLPSGTRAAYREHLHSCETCRAVVSGFETALSAIDGKKDTEINPFAATRTIGRIEALLEHEERRKQPVFGHVFQPALLTFIILLAVAIGFSLGRQFSGKSPGGMARQQEIRDMQSDLYITDLMNEEKTFILNE